MNDIVLTSLAILKTNWEKGGRSYVDYFVPFVADTLRATPGESFTAGQICEAVKARYGITIPVGPMETVLRRLRKDGLGFRGSGKFTPDREQLREHDLAQTRAAALRRHEALIGKLQEFAAVQFSRDIAREEADGSLLRHIDEHSVSLLKAAIGNAAYTPALGKDRDTDYIVSAFVMKAFESDPEAFDYLETVIKGSMLSSVLFLPDFGDVTRRFDRNTTLYLDTRLLLQALGYEGTEAQDAARGMFDLAYELGARLGCFEHTLDEVRGVLHGAEGAIGRAGRSGQPAWGVESYFIARGYTRSDITALIDRLETDLEGLRIQIIERQPHVAELTVSEVELEAALDTRVGYQRREPLLHDLDCLTAIHRIRGGVSPSRLEACRAIFVTTNRPLVGVAHDFFPSGPGTWPPAIADHDLATLLWLKKPLQAPDLPRKQVIADCFAALQPSGAVWTEYLDELERLQKRGDLTSDEFNVLRFSFDAKRALMNETLGDAQRVSPDTVSAVLEKARAAFQEPLQQELDRARTAGTEASLAATQAEAWRQRHEALIDRCHGEARTRARNQAGRLRRAANVGLLVIGALGCVIGLSSLLGLPSETLPLPVRVVAFVIGAAAAVMGLLNLFTAWMPREMARGIEVRAAKRLEARHFGRLMAREMRREPETGG